MVHMLMFIERERERERERAGKRVNEWTETSESTGYGWIDNECVGIKLRADLLYGMDEKI